MINLVGIALFAATLPSQAALANKGAVKVDFSEFSRVTDPSGRFLALERKGNGVDRTAYVTVFEYLAERDSLRKLYEAKLLNKKLPYIRVLARDGRFFVTFDEFSASGIGPHTVAIYDLARKEHTAYAGKEFLSDEIIRSLPEHSFIPGFKWFGKDLQFNEDSTKLYPTHPRNCKKEKVPYIVIDLPSRIVRTEPVPDMRLTKLIPDLPKELGWRPSRETVATDTTALPIRMTRTRFGVPDQLYELAPNKTEYTPRDDDNSRHLK